MHRKTKATKTKMTTNESYVGETIEEKVRRILNNKEPISDGAPLIFTERKEGTRPEYDIRTDRWEVAVEAMDKVHQVNQGRKDEESKKISDAAKEGMDKEIIKGEA